MSPVPEDMRRLADERAERRREGDYEAADALRDLILERGWVVRDRPDGYDLEVASEPEPLPRVRVEDVGSVLVEPPSDDVTVHWLAEGWPEDVRRGIDSFRRHEGGRAVQHVVVEAVEAPPGAWPKGVDVIRLERDPGFGSARNAGLRMSRGRLVLIVDGSVEATGDVFGPVERALADPSVGVVGPFGVVTEDLESFAEAQGPEVDAVEGYLMALRRELLEQVRFDRKFKFYRAADIDLSFQVKALGLGARLVDLPVRRHEHRRWEAANPHERWRLSKRNFYRFLDRFRGRTDLLVRPPG